MRDKRGLGKGLGALIPETAVFTGGRTILNIDVNKILPNPRQPRAEISPESLNELASSIREQGIAQPILTRPRGEYFELVAGERRWRAAKKAGLRFIPAIVKDFSDEESLEIALIENLQREDLNPLDEAEAYLRLNKEFGLTQVEIAKRVGKDRSTVANTVRLLDLPPEIQASLRKGEITPGHARPLLSVEEPGKQLEIWKTVIRKGLNVREVEQLIQNNGRLPSTFRRQPEPEILEIIDILTQHLGTKVRLHGTSQKGRIEVHYFSQADLERLVEQITGNLPR